MKKTKVLLKYFGLLIIAGVFAISLINFYVLSFSENKILKNTLQLENTRVGIVFGARMHNNGVPSDILKDRLTVAITAYKTGKIKQILVSGDNGREEYDEVTGMRDYLVKQGVKSDDVYLDYAGFDTYDTLYRAKEIFGVHKASLFTQEFHLKRANYIAQRLGINSVGVSTNLQPYIYANYYDRREVLARVKAFLNVEILKSEPKYLGNKVNMLVPQTELSKK